MWGYRVRTALSLAVVGVAAAGLTVAVGNQAHHPPSVTLVQAAAVTCLAVGPYRAPEPGSAGLPPGLALCPSGPVTVTGAGTVLDGWDVRGGIVVEAAGVVVRRSRITGDGTVPYGVRTVGDGTVRVEDTTLTGDFPEAAIGDERWTAERVEITGVTHDGARLGPGTRLRNSVVAAFTPAPGAEPDALVVDGDDVTVEDNRVEPGPATASAVRVAATPDGSAVIRGNVLGGGRYTVHEDAGGPGALWITGNRFRRDAVRGALRVSPSAVLADNTFDDGRLVPIG
jgi:hypothetical protein